MLVELLEDKEAMQWVAQAAQEEARRQLDKVFLRHHDIESTDGPMLTMP